MIKIMFHSTYILKNKFSVKLSLCLAFIGLFGFACEPSPSMMENSNNVPPPSNAAQTESNLTSQEREIRDMKNAGFQFIYVIKRRDGGAFDAQDKQYLRDNRPVEINRSAGTDDGKAFVIGSNFDFPPENMENLRKRFTIENYSPPPAEQQAANNTNRTQNR
jgi:hypothetical protein